MSDADDLAAVAAMLDALAETLHNTNLRLLALQTVLERNGLVTPVEVTGKMQEMSEYAEDRMEFGDTPELRAFREARRRLQGFEPPPEEA